jgi:hypothetical protein
MDTRLAGVFVLAEDRALHHGDDRLAEHLLVAADDGRRGAAPDAALGTFQQFTGHRLQGELLHVSSHPWAVGTTSGHPARAVHTTSISDPAPASRRNARA